MKKRSFLIILIFIIISVSGINISNATTTEQYQRWQELSEEEKQNAIQPRVLNIDIENSVKASNQKKFAVLKESMANKYFLKNDIKINVKNQEDTNSCWAFPIISSLETNIALTSKQDSPIYSIRHMEYATSKTFKDGINKLAYNREVGDGGNFFMGFAYLVSGKGPVLEKDMPFDNNQEKINLSEIDKKANKKITEYAEFPGIYKEYDLEGKLSLYTNGYTGIYKKTYTEDEINMVRTKIKQHIKENGALTAYTYHAEDAKKYYNTDKAQSGNIPYSYYCNDSSKIANHAITIVGWDDTYSKYNFSVEPKNDGAYIVLNSWGDDVLNGGYMYVSYDDAYIENNLMGVSDTEDINYDTIYQHDEYGYSYSIPFYNNDTEEELKSIYVANIFERNNTNMPKDNKKYDEYINEVSVYVAETSDVQIFINSKNDNLTEVEKVVTAGSLEPGYHTVKLASPIKLTGNKFVVAARYSNSTGVKIPFEFNYLSNLGESNYWDVVTSRPGESYIASSLEGWNDLTDVVFYQEDTDGDGIDDKDVCFKDTSVCVKAFTTFEEVKDIEVESVSLSETKKEMQVGDTDNLVVTINPSNATNKNVKWTSNNETIATVSSSGIITAVKEGTAIITVTSEDGDKTAKCEVKVKAKTNTDDEQYKVKDDENTTNIVAKGDKDINGNISTTKKQVKDTTIAQKILPYTGNIKKIFLIVLISVVCIGIVIFIKYRTMKDVK